MKKLLFVYIFISTTLICYSQNPKNGIVFQDNIVPRIDILIPNASLDSILDSQNKWSYEYHKADFIFTTGQTIDTIYDIGFRLRGNTSRTSKKKSFKVSFNTFEKGRKYHGLEKLNLNGEHNDPSIVRSKICFDLAHQMNIIAPRANHVKLYINGAYFGLYINVEHIDENYIKSRFGNNKGNLYKCLYPADLDYRGDSTDDYKQDFNGKRTYTLKINEEEDNYEDLLQFITKLNNAPDYVFRCQLESVFNVDSYLHNIVFDILTANWDGYIFNNNNFYLYHNPITDKFEYLLYDLDNTLGIDWFTIDWTKRNIYHWSSSGPRPLYDRIIIDPVYKSKFTNIMKQTLDSIFTSEKMNLYIENKKELLKDAALLDTYRSLDYGFSYDDFINSFNSPIDYYHTPIGISEYIYNRITNAYNQLQTDDIIPEFVNNSFVINNSIDSIQFYSHLQFTEELSSLSFYYRFDESTTYTKITMNDNGINGDLTAGDNIYSILPIDITSKESMSYYYTLDLTNESIVRYPACNSLNYQINRNQNLVINEFMASNGTTKADEEGEYDDWIELYNNGTDSIYLGDKYLTDNKSKPTKWLMPDIWLQADDYTLFWADKDEEQGNYHTNFKLSAAGEYIGIYEGDSTNFQLIDEYQYGNQSTDLSEGRYQNGIGVFQFLDPTPGSQNEILDVITTTTPYDLIEIAPNPITNQLNIHTTIDAKSDYNLIVYNTTGEIVFSKNYNEINQLEIPLADIPNGMYFIRINNGKHLIFSNRFTKIDL